MRAPALYSLLLGAVAALGFAPLELWPLTLASLAALMAVVHAAPTLKAALWRGYAFGVGHFTINNNWFQHAFDFQDKMPPELGYVAAVALALYLAVFPMMATGVAWRFRKAMPDAAYVLIFAALWIASEFVRARLFTGYAWNPLAVIWVPVQPVGGLAAYLGSYALSGLTVVLAGGTLLLPRRAGSAALVVGALAALLVGQALSYREFAPARALPADHPRLRVVQPNIGNEERGDGAGERGLAALIRGSGRPGAAPRLVVWPEGLIFDLLEDGYPDWVYDGRDPAVLRGRIARVLGPRDLLLTNAPTLGFDGVGEVASAANSVLAVGPDARLRGRYDKAHLVPYGEYLPMPWLLKPLGLAILVPGSLDYTPGPGPHALQWPGVGAVGIQICYEIIFSGEVVQRDRRPRLLFNPSNDAWFGRWGPPQHLAQARMRAIEEGLPIVRATPTGISAIIAADGRLLASIPHETAGAIELPMPSPLPPTPFSRAGNWLALLMGLLLATGAVAIRRRAR